MGRRRERLTAMAAQARRGQVEEPRLASAGQRPSCDAPLMRQLLAEAEARRHLAELRAAAHWRSVEERARLGQS